MMMMINKLGVVAETIHQQGTMDSKQLMPSNSGAILGLKRGGFCLAPPGVDDGFESFPVVLDSEAAEDEGPSLLGFGLRSFVGPMPKEKLHFWPCDTSKWLNMDMNILSLMLLCVWMRRIDEGCA